MLWHRKLVGEWMQMTKEAVVMGLIVHIFQMTELQKLFWPRSSWSSAAGILLAEEPKKTAWEETFVTNCLVKCNYLEWNLARAIAVNITTLAESFQGALMVRTPVLHLSEKPTKPQPEIISRKKSVFLHRSANSTSQPKGEELAIGPSGSWGRNINQSPVLSQWNSLLFHVLGAI